MYAISSSGYVTFFQLISDLDSESVVALMVFSTMSYTYYDCDYYDCDVINQQTMDAERTRLLDDRSRKHPGSLILVI